jgi:CheY-like chemotaxis protein
MDVSRGVAVLSSAARVYKEVDDEQDRLPVLKCLVAGNSRGATIFVANALRRTAEEVDIVEGTTGLAVHQILAKGGIDIALVDPTLSGVRPEALAEWACSGAARRTLVLLADKLAPDWPETASALGAYDVHLQPSKARQIKGLFAAHRCMAKTARTLLVDQSKRTRDLVRELIEGSRFPCAIEETDSSAYALEMAKEAHYDIAFVSASVLHDEGLELACKLATFYPDMKVVYMDQSEVWNTERLARQFGFAAYLRRPFGAVELEATMHRAHQLWRPYLLKALAKASAVRAEATVSDPPGASIGRALEATAPNEPSASPQA